MPTLADQIAPKPQEPSGLGGWLASIGDEMAGAFARYGRRSGAQRDASLALLNQASAPGTDPIMGAGQKLLGLAGLITHPLAFFPTREEWDQRLQAAGNDSRIGRSIGGFLSDLPSLIDPQMAAGGAALAAAPLLGKIANKVDDVADVGRASAMGEDGITAYHGTFSEPFDAPDFQKLGTFTKKNTQDDWVEGEKAYNLANLGFWSHQTPLEDTYKGGNILKVKVGGQGEHFNSLDELNGAINESGGVDAFRRKLMRQGYGHVSVADDEFGGRTSYVSLSPETAQIVKDKAPAMKIQTLQDARAAHSRAAEIAQEMGFKPAERSDAFTGSSYQDFTVYAKDGKILGPDDPRGPGTKYVSFRIRSADHPEPPSRINNGFGADFSFEPAGQFDEQAFREFLQSKLDKATKK